jgi:D-alanyl-D-alanine carboxypeptidase
MNISRRAFLLAVSSAALLGIPADEAEAKRRSKRARSAGLKEAHASAAQGQSCQFIFESIDGDVVGEELENRRRHPASLTKMMTLYCVMETMRRFPDSFNLKTGITITNDVNNPDFSKYGIYRSGLLKAGQVHSAEKLMKACGTISCAASATALAVHAGQFWRTNKDQSSLEAFVQHMNACARRLGMKDTNFRNPVGTPDGRHYSTAADMAKLLKALYTDYKGLSHKCMGHPRADLFPVAGKGRHTSGFLREHPRDTLFAKTGTTNAAGRCLAAMVEVKGKPYMGVIIGAASSRECNDMMESMVRLARLEKKRPHHAAQEDNAADRVSASGHTPVPEARPAQEKIKTLPAAPVEKNSGGKMIRPKLVPRLFDAAPIGPVL